MTTSVWGDRETQFFYEITPERILEAVESAGYQCTGRVLTLNSMENRVYEVEIELDTPPKTPSEKFRVVKFYRPGRWSLDQLKEEHEFLLELAAAEIPVVAPEKFPDGSTLKQVEGVGIYFCIFPKVGGRSPDELMGEQLPQVGRLLARIHSVGESHPAQHRVNLNPVTFGKNNFDYLLQNKKIPANLESRLVVAVSEIVRRGEEFFEGIPTHRIHGDCHLGNLLWRDQSAFFVDFDDMATGPAVQDVWLLVPGREEEDRRNLEKLLEGYEQMRPFPYDSLRLIEILRGLRMIHFAAWINKRWTDPAFPRAFEQYGSPRYWEGLTSDLEDQLSFLGRL